MRMVYRRFQKVLNNNDVATVDVNGRFLTILDNTSATDLEFAIGDEVFQAIPKGISVELPTNPDGTDNFFGQIQIRNTTGAAATITIAVSSGHIYDNRIVISSATVLLVNSTGGTLTTPVKYTTGTGAPGAPAVAAAASTREVWIYNGGGDTVWMGDANVDGSSVRGIPIAPGQTAIIDTAAAIYLRSVVAACDCGIAVLGS